MSETLVKTPVCIECGSEARPNALFCYHCGGALETVEAINYETDKSPSNVWFREEITTTVENEAEIIQVETEILNEETATEVVETELDEIETDDTKTIAAEVVEAEKIEVDENSDETENAEDEKSEVLAEDKSQVSIKSKSFKEKTENKTETKPKLKSAAALRKRIRPSARRKKVEIVWEERENSPNVWFIVFALILSSIVAGLVVAALYLK